MKETPFLKSLEIHNFRAFRHLLIQGLGQVNLIVGKNNVGKTCVLEALQLYFSKGSPEVMKEILNLRKESDIEKELIYSFKYLIHNRENIDSISENPIKIGPIAEEEKLIIEKGSNPSIPVASTIKDKQIHINMAFNISSQKIEYTFPYSFVSDKGISNQKAVQLWDKIYLTDMEDMVIQALQIIEPKIRSIGFVGSFRNAAERVAMVRVSDEKMPFPLFSMGEGMNRLFCIAAAMGNSAKGALLIDEIDNGIHYTVLPDLWKLVFEAARKMNAQVFATTHSWDCIEAFQQAAGGNGENDPMLISLRRKKNEPGNVVGVLFGKDDLEIVSHEQIEVR